MQLLFSILVLSSPPCDDVLVHGMKRVTRNRCRSELGDAMNNNLTSPARRLRVESLERRADKSRTLQLSIILFLFVWDYVQSDLVSACG